MNTEKFFHILQENGIDFFTGVPDSLLKDLGNYFYQNISHHNHIIAANEGNAIGLAAGSYIASGKVPLVYLQNSGLGNTVNPLLSMADKSLYAIPMIVLVGWRGQGGVNDAEQHLVQGPATPKIIEAMGFPYIVLSKDEERASEQIREVVLSFETQPQPYFVLVEKGSFDSYSLSNPPPPAGNMSREEALREIALSIPEDSFVVTTTGKTSREWYEVRETLSQKHSRDFLTVGSMGHTSSIALGMALQSNENVVCVDGDGSFLMHMGAGVLSGSVQLDNFKYILVNNFSHESVGGLPTPLSKVDFKSLFTAMGFRSYTMADTLDDLRLKINDFIQSSCGVLEVRVKQGSREDLSRPDKSAGELTHMLREEFQKTRSNNE